MNSIPKFDHSAADRLKMLLARYGQSPEVQGYPGAAGFLFAVANGPELVPPSEWLPALLGDEAPEVEHEEELQEFLNLVMGLYNWIRADAHSGGHPGFPPGMRLADKLEDNLVPEADLCRWSNGFLKGHELVERSWAQYVPEALGRDYNFAMMVLTIFESRQVFEEVNSQIAADESEPVGFSERLRDMLAQLPRSMGSYASLGNAIYQALAERNGSQPTRSEKIGRNEPCPCGSGRKFKKCCGNPALN